MRSVQVGIVRSVRRHPGARVCVASGVAALLLFTTPLGAQEGGGPQPGADSAFSVAFDHELAGRRHEAAIAYRQALRQGGDTAQVLFGLERVYAELGWTDSIVPLLDTLVRRRPRDATLRSIQLRALRMSGRADGARVAFEDWVALDRTDGSPYRTYARLLLDGGETAAADSVLRRAREVLGGTGAVALELAQTRAVMGLWRLSAESWRQAMSREAYLADAAAFALAPTPAEHREAVAAVLAAPPVEPAARRALATLRVGWGDVPGAWQALRALPPDDSTAAAWVAFADQAERVGAWSTARDAWLAALAVRPTLLVASRAANAALEAGDAATALAATQRVNAREEPVAWAQLVLPVRVRALAALGRAEDAAREVAHAEADSVTRALLHREIALGWVRQGDLARARAALDASGAAPDDEARGWIALYEGDLEAARVGLRQARDRDAETVLARAILARTRATAAPRVGAALLALASGDSAAAAHGLERAAGELPEVAPLLLTASARLFAATGQGREAERLWRTVVERHTHAPDAPEAALAWARYHLAAGDREAAIDRLEHLILTWPESALVPQARRALDVARGRVVAPAATPPDDAPPENR